MTKKSNIVYIEDEHDQVPKVPKASNSKIITGISKDGSEVTYIDRGKKIEDLSLDELIEFELGKTPNKELVAYIKEHYDDNPRFHELIKEYRNLQTILEIPRSNSPTVILMSGEYLNEDYIKNYTIAEVQVYRANGGNYIIQKPVKKYDSLEDAQYELGDIRSFDKYLGITIIKNTLFLYARVDPKPVVAKPKDSEESKKETDEELLLAEEFANTNTNVNCIVNCIIPYLQRNIAGRDAINGFIQQSIKEYGTDSNKMSIKMLYGDVVPTKIKGVYTDVCRAANIQIKFYHQCATALFAMGLKPTEWGSHSIGNSKAKVVNLALGNGHCSLMGPTSKTQKFNNTVFKYLDNIDTTGHIHGQMKYEKDIFGCPNGRIIRAEKRFVEVKFDDSKPKIMYSREIQRTYRPSTLEDIRNDKSIDIDEDPKFGSISSITSHLSKEFLSKLPICSDLMLTKLFQQADRHIGVCLFTDHIPEDDYERFAVDMSGSYSSFESDQSIYIGLPTGPYVISRHYSKTQKPLFYIPSNKEQILPEIAKVFGPEPLSCIAAPMYDYLVSIGAKIECQAYIYGQLIRPNFRKYILDRLKTVKDKNSFNQKMVLNSIIGTLIAGARKKTRSSTFYFNNKYELCEIQRSVESCNYNKTRIALDKNFNEIEEQLNIDMTIHDNSVTIDIPVTKHNSRYDVHSWILAYSQVAVLKEAREIQSMNGTLISIKTDAINFYFDQENEQMIEYTNNILDPSIQRQAQRIKPGQFKKEAFKGHKHIELYKKAEHEPKAFQEIVPDKYFWFDSIHEALKNDSRVTYNSKVISPLLFFEGPGGLGKTHMVHNVLRPLIEAHEARVIITSSTNNLQFDDINKVQKKLELELASEEPNEQRVLELQVALANPKYACTTHKAFGLCKNVPIRKNQALIAVDEIFMHSKKQLNIIKSSGVPLIIIGDSCQTTNSYGDPMTNEYLESLGFNTVTFNRINHGPVKVGRHNYIFGSFLDRFRDPTLLPEYIEFLKDNRTQAVTKTYEKALKILKKNERDEQYLDALDHVEGFSPYKQDAFVWEYYKAKISKGIKGHNEMTLETLDQNCRVIVSTHEQAFIINTHMKQKYKQLGLTEYPVRLIKARKIGSQRFPAGHKLMIPIDSCDIWWTRRKAQEEVPKFAIYEPAYTCTAHSSQGTEIPTDMLCVVAKCITDRRIIYTAITRAMEGKQLRYINV